MRVAVTGASGFVGRALCARLSASGIEPMPLVLRAGHRVPREKFDAIVHLAGIAHRRAAALELEHANVDLAQQVGLAAAMGDVRMIFLSSLKVHGEQTERPLQETAAMAPVDRYARSKARAEELLHRIPGLRLTVLRAPLVYGPGVRANFLALMSAVAGGWPLPLASVSNRRSLVYVGNLCDAIGACLRSTHATGRTFFVTDGAPVSTPALCRSIGRALGRRARLFSFPSALVPVRVLVRSLEADDSAIRRELGWRPPFSPEEGLEATASWYRAR